MNVSSGHLKKGKGCISAIIKIIMIGSARKEEKDARRNIPKLFALLVSLPRAKKKVEHFSPSQTPSKTDKMSFEVSLCLI